MKSEALRVLEKYIGELDMRIPQESLKDPDAIG